MDLYVGIDVGTSGCRAMAIDCEKRLIDSSRVNYSCTSHRGQSEQDPNLWWNHVKVALRDLCNKVDSHSIVALALDATSGSVLITDRTGHPLLPALMYNDNRAIKEAMFLEHHAPKTSAAHGTSSGLAKLMWLKKQLNSRKSFVALHQSDWLYFKMGAPIGLSDYNNCLKTGFDPIRKIWPDWIYQTGLELESLPIPAPPGKIIASVNEKTADYFGLKKDTKLVAGTTDSTAAFIATGAMNPGDAVTSLGSTLVLKILSRQAIFAPEFGVYSQPYRDYWLVGGGSNSGGNVLMHYFTAEQITDMTTKLSPHRSTGLSYYPLVCKGERFPINNPELDPVVDPRPEEDVVFFQALLEGMASIEYDGYNLLKSLGAPYPSKILTVGGGHKNGAWSEIRQKRLKVPVIIPTQSEAAYGTALLALTGIQESHKC